MKYYCFNGNIINKQPEISPQNRSFRYGDGIFETIKVFKNQILLGEFHFDRLVASLSLLNISAPAFLSYNALHENILELCSKNNCQESARVRVTVYRDDENHAGAIIEATSLDEKINSLNRDGWAVDLYPFARKGMDAFANLKSANYLPYVMADLYAKQNGMDECLVLNCNNKIADASKANVFIVLKNEVYTPALHQGCINGVKRRFVIEQLKKASVTVHQREIDEELLQEAEEVFLTNSIIDLRWVKFYRKKTYTASFTSEFYQSVFSTIYQ